MNPKAILKRIFRVGAMLALSGCGLSDQNSFMPAALRQPESPAPYEEPYPDMAAMAKTYGRSLFADGPAAATRPTQPARAP